MHSLGSDLERLTLLASGSRYQLVIMDVAVR